MRHHGTSCCLTHDNILLLLLNVLLTGLSPTSRDIVVWTDKLGFVAGLAASVCGRSTDYARVVQCWCPCMSTITLLLTSHLLFEILRRSSPVGCCACVGCFRMSSCGSSWIDWTDHVLGTQVRRDALILMMLLEGSNCCCILLQRGCACDRTRCQITVSDSHSLTLSQFIVSFWRNSGNSRHGKSWIVQIRS